MTVAVVFISFARLRPLEATRLFGSKSSVRGGHTKDFVERLRPLTSHLRVARDGKRCLPLKHTNKFQCWSAYLVQPSWKLSNRHLATGLRIGYESRKIS